MIFLQYPANYYGLITGVFVIPTGLVFIPLLLCYAQSPYMTNRGWPLVLLSNLAYLGLAGGSAISYIFFPTGESCNFELWSRFLKFSVYGFSLLLRAWIFAFKYHTARSQVTDQIPTAIKWCLKNKWLISPWFLAPLWIITFGIHILFPILVLTLETGDLLPVTKTSQCTSDSLLLAAVNWILPALYAMAVVFLMFQLRLSEDAFHIRDELRAVGAIWVVGSILWLLTNVSPADWMIGYYLPGFVWLQLSFMISFCVSTIWVWNLSRQHGASCFARPAKYIPKSIELAPPPFISLLRDDLFRKDFSNFLCLQFCVENLFFWEAVQQFHSIHPNEMKTEAKAMFDKYLASGSAYEVNIPHAAKKLIETQIKEGVFSHSMFDDAAAATLKLMELDSYPRFVSRPGGMSKPVKMQNSRDHLI